MSNDQRVTVSAEAYELYELYERIAERERDNLFMWEQQLFVEARDRGNVELLRILNDEWVAARHCHSEVVDIYRILEQNGVPEPWTRVTQDSVTAYEDIHASVRYVMDHDVVGLFREYLEIAVLHGDNDVVLMSAVLRDRLPSTAEDFRMMLDQARSVQSSVSLGVL